MDWQVKDIRTGNVAAQFTTRADAKEYVEEMDRQGLYGRFRIVSVRESESYARQAEGAEDVYSDGLDSGRASEWLEVGRLIAGRYSN